MMRRAIRLIVLAWLGVLPAAPAPAAEADLARRLAENQAELAAVDQRLDRLEAQLQNQGLIGLLNQMNSLKADLARLRGAQEEQAHQLTQLDNRHKAAYADLDERLKEMTGRLASLAANPPVGRAEPPPADAIRLQPARSLAAQTPPPTETDDDTKAYEAALAHFRAADYKQAVGAFQGFYNAHPASPLAANALYWMGLAFATQGDHAKAAAAYEKLIASHAGSAKVPDAMVSLARAHLQMGDPGAARTQLDAVVAKYPLSKSAEAARKLLATLN